MLAAVLQLVVVAGGSEGGGRVHVRGRDWGGGGLRLLHVRRAAAATLDRLKKGRAVVEML